MPSTPPLPSSVSHSHKFAIIELNPKAAYYGRNGTIYLPDENLIAAFNAALLLGMPLLLTGEPGCGKTDFAFAAAGGLYAERSRNAPATHRPKEDHSPLVCYVRSDTRARDLLYRYDAVRRFGDAQEGGEAGRMSAKDARAYVQLEAMGIALQSQTQQVVLIDEIDKAPRDLPNDLLNEIERGDFEIPEIPADTPFGLPSEFAYRGFALHRDMRRPEHAPKPVVIITSNAERQLPEPFLRRCVFFHIKFPDKAQLSQILQNHLDPSRPTRRSLASDAAEVLTMLREQPLTKKPATAELVNWGQAIERSQRSAELAASVSSLAAAIRTGQTPMWSNLPLPGCLLKLVEDWITLGLRPRVNT